MSARVAINGFGRTGRQALKAIWSQHRPGLEIAAIGLHAPEDTRSAAHLLRHDSNYGKFDEKVGISDSHLLIGSTSIPLVSAEKLEELPWERLGVDLVIEASGEYTAASSALGHIRAGARKVLITAASDDADYTVIGGVNENGYDPERHHVLATGTDTTNAVAVVLRALCTEFVVERALVTGVHAYTNAQKLIDSTDENLRRARSAPLSIVPVRSATPRGVGRYLPEMEGRVDGYSVRVPVSVVSILDIVVKLSIDADPERINGALRQAAGGALGRVLAVADEPLVSSDYRCCPYSAVVDAPLTMGIGALAKISAWYDNEWGYSNRVADAAAMVAGRLVSE